MDTPTLRTRPKKLWPSPSASGLISLADDSGLEVEALNGAPGLYSARYGLIASISKMGLEETAFR